MIERTDGEKIAVVEARLDIMVDEFKRDREDHSKMFELIASQSEHTNKELLDIKTALVAESTGRRILITIGSSTFAATLATVTWLWGSEIHDAIRNVLVTAFHKQAIK